MYSTMARRALARPDAAFASGGGKTKLCDNIIKYRTH